MTAPARVSHRLRNHYSVWVVLLWSVSVCFVGRAARAQEADQPTAGPATVESTAPAVGSGLEGVRVLEEREDRLIAMLPNRLVVIVQELHANPVVSVQVHVKTGSIYEQQYIGAGLSHFLEHLVAGGSTKNRTEAQTSEILGRIGARTNASTSLDTVEYYINTTADHSSDAIELLSDWLPNSLITQAEYERERDVIQSEFAMGRGEPARILWRATQLARYAYHPARHPTIGYLDEFVAITRDQIYSFYKKMYVPNNMVFVVAGDVDRHAVVKQVASLWKDVPTGPLPEIKLPVEPEINQPRQSVVYADVRRPRLRLLWPGTQLGGQGDYAMDLLAGVLGQGDSSRLVRTLRDEQGLVTSIQAFNLSYPWGRGFLGIDAEVIVPPPGTDRNNPDGSVDVAINRVRDAIIAQVNTLKTQGVTDDELARIKRQTLARVAMSTQTASDFADRLTSDFIGQGDPDYLNRYARTVQSIPASQIAAVLDTYLVPQKTIDVRLLPTDQDHPIIEPRRPEAQPIPDDIQTTPVQLDNAALFDRFRARPQSSDDPYTPIQTSPPVRYTLSNGLRLIVARNTVVPAVAVHVYQVGGLLSDTPGQEGVANAVAQMLMRGTTSRTAQQIADTLDSLGADLSTPCGNNTSYARATCLAEDFDTVVNLLADVWVHPAFPEDEWKNVQTRILASIDRSRDNWTGELQKTFLPLYFGADHPWSQQVFGRREVVQGLTVEDLRLHHRDYLGASTTVVCVVGDIEPDQARQTVERAFADMPQTPRVVFTPPEAPHPTAQVVQTPTQKGLAAVMVGLGPGIARTSPDYASLSVLANVLSSFPTGRLEQALRGDGPGLVYAVWAYNMSGVAPGYFNITFNAQPTTVLEALRRVMVEVDRVKNQPVDPATLQRAQAATLSDEIFSRESLDGLAGDLSLDWLYGLGGDSTTRFINDVHDTTPELLRVIAQTYLNDPVIAVLCHEKLDESALREAAGATYQAPVKDSPDGSTVEPEPDTEPTPMSE
ncbi:MAG: hypothetical protein GC164_11380 [Phycisphaera sp.]|nr:hypothetical protein [Phycisphaera sp.]